VTAIAEQRIRASLAPVEAKRMETPRRLRPGEEERALVARMRSGDESAFDEFAERYLPGLHRFALRRLDGDRELARDVVQTTMCNVIEKLDGYRGEAPLFTWLCACCRNAIGGHFRRRDRRPREVGLDRELDGELHAVSPAAAAGGPQERLLRFEAGELVHLALDSLPGNYARAVEWRYLEGTAVDEIARRLGATYKAAESLLSRARAAFREAYERLAASPDLGAEP
jgi:RNA polymerase sigma-70 factor (ECF subfamily)